MEQSTVTAAGPTPAERFDQLIAAGEKIEPRDWMPEAYRRTMIQLRTEPPAPAGLPLVAALSGDFYFKPETGGRLGLSPHDETATDPCDAAPEELLSKYTKASQDLALRDLRIEGMVGKVKRAAKQADAIDSAFRVAHRRAARSKVAQEALRVAEDEIRKAVAT